jgi:hypothetical protein
MSNYQTSNKKMEVVYSIVVAWGGGMSLAMMPVASNLLHDKKIMQILFREIWLGTMGLC